MDDLTQMRLTSTSSPCAKVFIQRDYSDGVGVKFETKLPTELVGKMDSNEFEQVIERINAIYADAERLSPRTYFENCFACLTAYLLLICMKTNYEKVGRLWIICLMTPLRLHQVNCFSFNSTSTLKKRPNTSFPKTIVFSYREAF